jgi:isoquinoline 1-oxidoreductase beta subunit
VLELAAERAGWGLRPLPPGRARGVALHESFGSVVAQVVEVSIEKGQPRVHRVVCAIDCGTVVKSVIIEGFADRSETARRGQGLQSGWK